MDTKKLITYVGETPITLLHHLTHQPCDTKLIRVHGDELSAKECSLAWLQAQGGEFIDIDNPCREIQFQCDQQNHSVDPNRMFSMAGIAASLEEQGSKPSPQLVNAVQPLAEQIRQLLQPAKIVIALHNNLDFNIHYYQKGGECAPSANQVHQVKEKYPHDFVLVSHPDDFAYLQSQQINVVLLNEVSDHPGSLSEYCMQQGQRYFNIEAYRGHLAEQHAMLSAIMRGL